MGELGYEVVYPLGRETTRAVRPKTRLDTLEGKTICELWNDLYRGDMIFPMLEELLSKRYPGVKFVSYKEFGLTHGTEEDATIAALADNLSQKGCDAVISGLGG